MFKLRIILVSFLYLANGQILEQQKVESFQLCWTDADCKPSNSYCYGNDDDRRGRCKCISGYVINRNETYYECQKPAKLGDACEKDFQCMIGAGSMAVCNKYDICECNELSHSYKDGYCYKNTDVGDFCISDAYCKLDNDRFASCNDGRCECSPNERPTPDKRRCLLSKNLGEECTSDENCQLIPNAHCEIVCRCLIDYVITRDGNDCLKAATRFGDECTENDQCSKLLKDAVCERHNCTCPGGFHPYGNNCMQSKRVGDICFNNEECIFNPQLRDNVICDSTCRCVYGESSGDLGCVLGSSAKSFRNISIFFLLTTFFLCL